MNSFTVAISKLELFLLSTVDDPISIMSFAENACDEGGRSKFCGVGNEAREKWPKYDVSIGLWRRIRKETTGICRKPSST